MVAPAGSHELSTTSKINDWSLPFTCIIAGPTSSGKSYWTTMLLQSDIMKPTPQKIFWFYGIYQPLFAELSSRWPNWIQFISGLPPKDLEGLLREHYVLGQHVLFVIDDQMQQACKDSTLSAIFVQGSHHLNISIILILQNLFCQGAQARSITLNAQKMVLFKNARDKQQIAHLGRQLYPSEPDAVYQAYNDATARPYGYLYIDLRGNTDDRHRLLTNILPAEGVTTVYVPKKL